MTVWIKHGVMGDLSNPAQKCLGRIANFLFPLDTFITSIREGNHSPGSLHYRGDAFDIRNNSSIKLKELRHAAGADFDVIQEGDHIHIEYDPKTS